MAPRHVRLQRVCNFTRLLFVQVTFVARYLKNRLGSILADDGLWFVVYNHCQVRCHLA